MNPLHAPTCSGSTLREILRRCAVGARRHNLPPHRPPRASGNAGATPQGLDADITRQGHAGSRRTKAPARTEATIAADTFRKETVGRSGSMLAAASFNRGM
jgi:hypothetical protein